MALPVIRDRIEGALNNAAASPKCKRVNAVGIEEAGPRCFFGCADSCAAGGLIGLTVGNEVVDILNQASLTFLDPQSSTEVLRGLHRNWYFRQP